MIISVRPSVTANAVIVGSRVLPLLKQKLKRQNIAIIKIITTRTLLTQHTNDFDEIMNEYRKTFRNCKSNPGNVCAIVARGNIEDIQVLACNICDSVAAPALPMTSDELNELLRSEDHINY